MAEGFIFLHRQLANHPLWLAEPFTRAQAFVDLLMLANHKPGYIRVRGIRVVVLRGQVAHSEATLSARWQWSRGKVRRFVHELEVDKMAATKRDNKISIINILNYDKYQSQRNTGGTANDTADGTTNGPQTDTNKNEKNEKKKDIKAPLTPSGGRVCVYCGVSDSQVNWAFEVDHFIPKVAGGSDAPENLVDACHVCNQIKQMRIFASIEEAKAHIHWTLWTTNRKRYEAPRAICFGGKEPQGLRPATVRSSEVVYTDSFNQFWSVYPKPVGKDAAFKAWQAIPKKHPGVKPPQIIAAIKAQVAADHFRGRDGEQYFKNPATWLNQACWNDIVKAPSLGGSGLGIEQLLARQRMAQGGTQ